MSVGCEFKDLKSKFLSFKALRPLKTSDKLKDVKTQLNDTKDILCAVSDPHANVLSPALARPYFEDREYRQGEWVLRDFAYWKCLVDIPYPGEVWNEDHWEQHRDLLEDIMALGKAVRWEDIEGKPQVSPLPDRYTDKDVKRKVDEIAGKLSGRTSVLLAALLSASCLFGGVDVQKRLKEDIANDEPVVTDVAYQADPLDTNAVRFVSGQTATNVVGDLVSDWARKPNPRPETDITPALAYTTAVSNRLENSKQDKITDLETIREGARRGNTALQEESDPFVADWARKPNPAPVTDLSPAFAYTTAVSNKLEAGKQDVIPDLEAIRTGAERGMTAVQSLEPATNYTDAAVSGANAYTTSVSNKLETGKQDLIPDLETIREAALTALPRTYTNTEEIALGKSAVAGGSLGTAVGCESAVYGSYGTAFGYQAISTNVYGVALGYGTCAKGKGSIAIGVGAFADSHFPNTPLSALAEGYLAEAEGGHTVALGSSARAYEVNATALGSGAVATGNCAVAISGSSIARGQDAIAIGRWAQATNSKAVVIGGNGYSHGEGSFNVNPTGGARGFWIGNSTLASIIEALAPAPELPEKWALANVTNSQGRAVSAVDVGALPATDNDVDGKQVSSPVTFGTAGTKTVLISGGTVTETFNESTTQGFTAFGPAKIDRTVIDRSVSPVKTSTFSYTYPQASGELALTGGKVSLLDVTNSAGNAFSAVDINALGVSRDSRYPSEWYTGGGLAPVMKFGVGSRMYHVGMDRDVLDIICEAEYLQNQQHYSNTLYAVDGITVRKYRDAPAYLDYSYKLLFPLENGTFATREWTDLSKRDLTDNVCHTNGYVYGIGDEWDMAEQEKVCSGNYRIAKHHYVDEKNDYWDFYLYLNGSEAAASDVYFPTEAELDSVKVITWEIAFKSGYSDTKSYRRMSVALKDDVFTTYSGVTNIVSGKQDRISDLETIRSGAAAGATALQSVPNLQASIITSGTFPDSRIASASVWNGKQAKLVSGSNIKTINNQSILGSGNIEISAPQPAAEKRYAMFIIRLNETAYDDQAGHFTQFELKASTNNFSTAYSQKDRCCFYSHSGHAEGEFSTNDGMHLFINHGGADQRSYVRIKNTAEGMPNYAPAEVIVIVDAALMNRDRSDGSWLYEGNEDVMWTWVRTKDNTSEFDGGADHCLWRPITPVRWYSTLPNWAREGL